jgi:hypothetical protein
LDSNYRRSAQIALDTDLAELTNSNIIALDALYYKGCTTNRMISWPV